MSRIADIIRDDLRYAVAAHIGVFDPPTDQANAQTLALGRPLYRVAGMEGAHVTLHELGVSLHGPNGELSAVKYRDIERLELLPLRALVQLQGPEATALLGLVHEGRIMTFALPYKAYSSLSTTLLHVVSSSKEL